MYSFCMNKRRSWHFFYQYKNVRSFGALISNSYQLPKSLKILRSTRAWSRSNETIGSEPKLLSLAFHSILKYRKSRQSFKSKQHRIFVRVEI